MRRTRKKVETKQKTMRKGKYVRSRRWTQAPLHLWEWMEFVKWRAVSWLKS